jgi:hypothetical protein
MNNREEYLPIPFRQVSQCPVEVKPGCKKCLESRFKVIPGAACIVVGLKRDVFPLILATTCDISVFFTGAGKKAGFFRNIGVPFREKELVSGLLALRVLAHYPPCIRRRTDEGEHRIIPPSP